MRKLLMLCVFALLATMLPAQTTPRNGAQAAPSSRNPASNTTKTRTALNPTTSSRTSLQPAPAKPRTVTTTPARPESGTENATATSRTAQPAKPAPAAGAKTVPTITPKTVPATMPEPQRLKQEEKPAVRVQWLSVEEALEKSKTDKRKIFIYVYTEWCGYCKLMDESTFTDPAVAEYLNGDNYYAVKFNAEQQEDIVFNNRTYHFRRNGSGGYGYHELAAEWLNNSLKFPTVVFLDESLEVIQPISSYLKGPKLEAILHYYGTNSHKTTPWETYERRFNGNQR
ncbi:MAG: DUF255 domain-containing protein [Saprospirales bacterium]|jgi:thioredoxin-related protein|nr:DUF255 domain-containing protein [Saprospirales bacterium]MBK8923009.1 DUF255 domain-containing protein [Saprospirales bacterium]